MRRLLFRLWIAALMRRWRALDDDALIDRLHAALSAHPWLAGGAADGRNPYGFDAGTAALTHCMALAKKAGRRPRFDLDVIDQAVFDRQSASGKPAIIVSVHGPADAAINRFLASHRLRWTLLAAGPAVIGKVHFLGHVGPVDIVTRSGDTLLILRRKLREGIWVCADIDYRSARSWPFGRVRPGLSPTLLDLAVRLGVPVLYVRTRFAGPRRIELRFGAPGIGNPRDGVALAEDFRAWLLAVGEARDWQIARWQPR